MTIEERELRELLEHTFLLPAAYPDPLADGPRPLWYLGRFGVDSSGSLGFGILGRCRPQGDSLHVAKASMREIGFLPYEQVCGLESRIISLPDVIERDYRSLWDSAGWLDRDSRRIRLRRLRQLDSFRNRRRPDEILAGFDAGAGKIIGLPVLVREYSEKKRQGTGKVLEEPEEAIDIHAGQTVAFRLVLVGDVPVPLCGGLPESLPVYDA